jgi:SAM-dependent methyltransferase
MTDFSNAEVANRVAGAWEQNRRRVFESHRAISEWLVDHIDPQPGQTILDVCAGPGETGFLAAERVGPQGKLLSTDLSEEMVAAASRGAKEANLTNVEARVMDAQALDLGDASVDGALSRYGIMLVPEPARAVAEVRRVLRSGGRFAFAVWGPVESNPWLTIIGGAVKSVLGGEAPAPAGPNGPFALPSVEINRALLEDAGFTEVTADALPGATRFESFDEYWDIQSSLAGPLVQVMAGMTDDQRRAAREAGRSQAEQYRTGDGDSIELPSLSIVAAGTA